MSNRGENQNPFVRVPISMPDSTCRPKRIIDATTADAGPFTSCQGLMQSLGLSEAASKVLVIHSVGTQRSTQAHCHMRIADDRTTPARISPRMTSSIRHRWYAHFTADFPCDQPRFVDQRRRHACHERTDGSGLDKPRHLGSRLTQAFQEGHLNHEPLRSHRHDPGARAFPAAGEVDPQIPRARAESFRNAPCCCARLRGSLSSFVMISSFLEETTRCATSSACSENKRIAR